MAERSATKPSMDFPEPKFPPYRAKVVEPIPLLNGEQRRSVLRSAHFNLFNLDSDQVVLDFLTDSGTGAISAAQQAAMMLGDESYAGARSFRRFEKVVKELTGFPHLLPTHQGRAAERILFSILGGPGRTVVSNSLFDTTRANTEWTKAEGLDLPCRESEDPFSEDPFKGNMDLEALRQVLADPTRVVPVVVMTLTNNSVAGAPVSLENLREVRMICDEHGVPLFLDVARFAENAWLVKEREPGQENRTPREIAKEFFSLADGCWMSSKKDAFAPIGGFLALRDDGLAEKLRELLILGEGFSTYGGMAGHDLEILATGLEEVLEESYLRYRVASIRRFGERLRSLQVPVVWPTGGHAVYLDAVEFLPHIPLTRYPGQALACALYETSGIRACELGSVAFGQSDPETGFFRPAQRELVRLAVPRRVYFDAHLDWAAQALGKLLENKDRVQGVRITWAPRALRHFSAHFEPNDPSLPVYRVDS